MNNDFSRNLVLKLQNKLLLLNVILLKKSQNFLLTVFESQKLPNFQALDTESKSLNLSGLCMMEYVKFFRVIAQTFKIKTDLIEYRRKNTYRLAKALLVYRVTIVFGKAQKPESYKTNCESTHNVLLRGAEKVFPPR